MFEGFPLLFSGGKCRVYLGGACVFFLLLFPASSPGLTKIAVFPLSNTSRDKSFEWVSVAVCESFSRLSRFCPDLQVLSPAFLFQVDSSGWKMDSDSLLRLHWARWGWNVACGGSYKNVGNAVSLQLRTVVGKNNRPVKRVLTATAPADSMMASCADLFRQFLAAIGSSIPPAEERPARLPITKNSAAFATYCAGFCYEVNNNYAAAITSYARAAEIDPSFGHALCRLARLFRACGNSERARQFYDRIASLSECPSLALASAADFYVDNDLPAKALDFIHRHETELEQTPEGMTATGKSFLLTGEMQRAVAMFTRAVARGPADLETDFILGKAYLSTGEFSKACDVFNRLVKYRPDYTRYYALLGAAYRSSGRLMESLQVLENTIKTDQDNLPVLVNLSQTYFELGWYQKALQLLLHAQELNPDVPDICVNLGAVYWFMGKHTEADAMLAKAAAMKKNAQSALNNEANTYLLGGDVHKAISTYKKAEKIGGKNETVLINLANAYYSLNEFAQAAAYYEEVIAISPSRLEVLTKLASIAEKRGKEMDAVPYYRKILEVSPRNEEALTRLSDILIRHGQFKEALEPLEAYLVDFPSSLKFLLVQADAYRQMGWYEVAIMKYQAIIHDYPNDWHGLLGIGKSMFDLIRFKDGKDYDNTIRYLKIAADLNRSSPEPDYIIGTIYGDYKRYSELAVDHWKSALTKATDPAMIKTLNDCIAKAKQ
jgi:tetratricopeptide (TPR) repeat protein